MALPPEMISNQSRSRGYYEVAINNTDNLFTITATRKRAKSEHNCMYKFNHELAPPTKGPLIQKHQLPIADHESFILPIQKGLIATPPQERARAFNVDRADDGNNANGRRHRIAHPATNGPQTGCCRKLSANGRDGCIKWIQPNSK